MSNWQYVKDTNDTIASRINLDGSVDSCLASSLPIGTTIDAAPLPTHEEIVAAVWERIKAERDRRKLDGGYCVGSDWFHSDTFSRTQQIGLVMMGASIPSGLMWKTMAGSFVPMTQTLAEQVFAAGAAQDVATFQAAETHKAAMEASPDPAAYDFSGGWPPIFGE
jgi:hypothetical protein